MFECTAPSALREDYGLQYKVLALSVLTAPERSSTSILWINFSSDFAPCLSFGDLAQAGSHCQDVQEGKPAEIKVCSSFSQNI